ncbi:putative signal transducing protein [Agathobaculum sp. Marseille-P7918]|uniref:putative signal transducing protein n=1 Tax=Agathobaculum sp. Marseille-P7918 TaxID=2479843 RepID=UPI00356784EC
MTTNIAPLFLENFIIAHSLPYFLTHRLVFSSFSAEDVLRVKEKLKANEISFLIKKKQSNLSEGTFGQLVEKQIAYDVYVPNEDFDRAKHVLNLL